MGILNFLDKLIKPLKDSTCTSNNTIKKKISYKQSFKESNNTTEMYKSIKKELDTSLYERIYSKAKNNYAIMKLFPEGIPKQTVYHVIGEYFKGRRSEDISKDIEKTFFDISNKDIKKISSTICNIASAALNQSRGEKLGLNWYIWRTCMDSAVRSSHKKMEGVLVNWNEPPSPERLINKAFIGEYHAGEGDQCRCYAENVVDIDFIKFPRRVYYQGKIQSMNKTKFKSIM